MPPFSPGLVLDQLEVRVAREHRGLQEQAHGGILQLGPLVAPAHLALGLVALPGHFQQLPVGPEPAGGHLVLGEGAGLVRADDRGAAEGFDRGQLPDEGVPLDHLLHAEREADRDDGRQALGHRGDGEADRGHEHLEDVAALEHADEEHERADDERGDAQPPSQLRELLLQRGVLVLLLLEHRRDEADLRSHAGLDHDPPAPAEHGHRAGVGHGEPVAERRLVLHGRTGLLFHRHALAGQRGLLDPQVDRLDEAHVGGHVVAGLQQDHVAGHQLARGHHPGGAVAHHPRLGGGHLLQGRERLLGLGFLHHADDGVQDDDEDDRSRVHPLAEHEGDDRGRDQDDDEEVLELRREEGEEPRARLLHQLVRTDLREAARRLGGRDAPSGVAREGRAGLARRETVP